MGTVFNNENSHLFSVLVEACKYFSDKYAIIVSTGDEKTYNKYINSSLNSENILMVAHTPQVEILKRAHLFITHAGMNSVSEAVHYGVPIICLPLSGDQPFVAWRVADDLGLGIRLKPDDTLTVDRVKTTISTILNDPTYRKKALKFSQMSKNYLGHKTACDLTVKLIQENELKEKFKTSQQHQQQFVSQPQTPLTTSEPVTLPPDHMCTPLIDKESAKNLTASVVTTVPSKRKKLKKIFNIGKTKK